MLRFRTIHLAFTNPRPPRASKTTMGSVVPTSRMLCSSATKLRAEESPPARVTIAAPSYGFALAGAGASAAARLDVDESSSKVAYFPPRVDTGRVRIEKRCMMFGKTRSHMPTAKATAQYTGL